MKRRFIFLAISVVLVVAGLEFLLYRELNAYTSVAKRDEPNQPADLLLAANNITFRTMDGADLQGWLIQGKPKFPAIIIAHDYGSNRSLTLSKLEPLITALNKQGYFLFVFDFRGHGKSSQTSTLGYSEAADLAAALKALLRYKQIAPRVGVLGIGMGAIAASAAFHNVDEVKLLVLDSIYEDIPAKYADAIVAQWPFLKVSRYVLRPAIGWNLRQMLNSDMTDVTLKRKMSELYPKVVVFVEKLPLRENVRRLYEANREPKELLLMNETAAGELLGTEKDMYVKQLMEKVREYLPPVNQQKTLEIPK